MTTPVAPNPRLRRFIALATVAVAAMVAWLAWDSAQAVMVRLSAEHGTVTVSECALQTLNRHVSSYTCTGDFLSDGGELRVTGVRFVNVGDLDPGESVAGTLSGSGDATLHPDEELGWQLAILAAGVAALAALFVKLLRLRPHRATGQGPPRRNLPA